MFKASKFKFNNFNFDYTSHSRRKNQYKKIFEADLKMRSCFNCIHRGINCLIHRSSDKCAFCVRLEISCDLAVSSEDWERLNVERERLRNEIAKYRKTLSNIQFELIRLKKEQESLGKNASVLIAREDRNLKKIKENAFKTSEAASTIFEFFDFELFFLFESIFFSFDVNFFHYTDLSIFEHSSNVS